MKRTMTFGGVLLVLVVALLVVFGFKGVSPAAASTTATGVPVKCIALLLAAPPYTVNMTCKRPDGPDFTSVPNGSYLLVTDFHVIGPETGAFRVIFDPRDEGGVNHFDFMVFAGNARETKSEHFTTPLFVLKQGWYIQASSEEGTALLQAVGVLSTNYNFLPAILK